MSQIIHKEPSGPRTINKRIPKDLETICLKAMEKDPDRRYQTADQMAKDLRCFVNRYAISARRVGPVERGVRWARKNKALSAMACIALFFGVVAAVFFYRDRQMRQEQAKELALTAAMGGKLEEALKYVDRAKTYGAARDWTLMLQSQVDLFNGKSKDAVEKLEVAVNLNSGNVAAESMLATAYEADGQFFCG